MLKKPQLFDMVLVCQDREYCYYASYGTDDYRKAIKIIKQIGKEKIARNDNMFKVFDYYKIKTKYLRKENAPRERL